MVLVGEEKDFLKENWNNIIIDPTMEKYYKSIIKKPTGKMFLADYSISNKLLTLVDAVISPLSTMLIESLLKGKPALAFFPVRGEAEFLRPDYIHFAEFIEIKEAFSCFQEKDFIPLCKNLINQIGDDSVSKVLKRRAEFFVAKKNESYGYQLNNLCQKMTGKKIK